MSIPNRQNFKFFEYMTSSKLDKQKLFEQEIAYMLARTQKIFRYNNLPDTIPQNVLERYLQVDGYTIITKANDGKLYVFYATLGGIPDEYYRPTVAIVNNPYLQFNKELRINKDCILCKNDSYLNSLMPLFQKICEFVNRNKCVI
jgi:hypothetical protein